MTRLTAGVVGSKVGLTRKNKPGPMMRIGPGGESTRVGSGNLANPCARMHLANLSAARNWLSVALTPPDAPPGASRAHAPRSDLNAGDRGLIPVPARLSPPPPPLGSGKVGTPFARMQSANFSPSDSLPWPVVCDDPHAATATTQLTTARAPDVVVARLAHLVVAGLYARPTNSAVTPLRCCYAPVGILAGAFRNGHIQSDRRRCPRLTIPSHVKGLVAVEVRRMRHGGAGPAAPC